MATRLKPGDVLELSRPAGLIYVQYLGRDSGLTDGVLVCPRVKSSRPPIDAALFEGGYVIFYPLSFVARKKMADVVGWLPTEGLPDRYRQVRGFDQDGRINRWAVLSPEGGSVKYESEMTSEEKRYTRRSIWTDVLLVERVCSGWQPEDEWLRKDEAGVSGPDQTPVLEHYFYFSDASCANQASTELRALGFATVQRLSAHDESMLLVLATETDSTAELDPEKLRRQFAKLAKRFSGEYDGWELGFPDEPK